MRKTTFIFAGIISAVIGTAFAAGENTVTSKSYVDAQDALKQNKLHTASATPANNGATVVTYTDTEGTPGERGIFNYDNYWDSENFVITSGHEDDLVTAQDVIPAVENLYNDIDDIYESINVKDYEPISVPSLTCANNDCTLYSVTMVAGIAHRLTSCNSVNDCPECNDRTYKVCASGVCKCLAGQCKGYEESVTSASECCSGYLKTGQNRCGCSSYLDCPSGHICDGNHSCQMK